ncbi:Methyl-accepting chemotaxis protein I (serine chemoreceptor protein) [Rhodovulum sp. P5]|uniref:methyl-accepting chemotaxis protein n=1 Tax=Rhodovulum sp. P5 TaxID=1564506 RepID=UPI0009C37B70|nr:methyl-accepting chemotaxis protein [Rhodovulum sp. P5]ARE42255.1 Methyl-accepting chemotaxis protein I (serine chemoreceptor protein) [Rhodovulum sp. P5]
MSNKSQSLLGGWRSSVSAIGIAGGLALLLGAEYVTYDRLVTYITSGAVTIDPASAAELADRLRSGFVLIGGIAVLSAAALWGLVLGPLARLTRGTEALAHGNLAALRPLRLGVGEVRRLHAALSRLHRTLSEREAMEEKERLSEIERYDRWAEQHVVVTSLANGLQDMADGDFSRSLDIRFPEAFEGLRQNFNRTMDNLNDLIGLVAQNAIEIHARSDEISSSSDDLSHRTENQAATLEETAAALDELTTSVKTTADSAAKVEHVVRGARGDAEQSGEVVKQAVGAMSEIKDSSDGISQIIGVIDDIAFQTNLLALNAGVEAARAGEAGRGFAVVASEVRALAQRSSEAAREIKDLIDRSSSQVASGVGLVNRTGEALTDIVSRVTQISDMVSEIAVNAQEQSVGLGEINVGVTQLDQVTQQNAAMVEEATAAAATLRQETERLEHLISRFRLREGNGVSLGAGPGVTNEAVEEIWRDFLATGT